ncbi:MAG: hypothetical protein A3F13_01860 [Gammaproteobacteria bacterium RIFCSPHIGHO2_12_FULL_40_19]|nr:MAG: hypothetical protein A3F13_01860 [Gammaproteobacteria bacterium RIFCSPHIGHO2_12_FULL_40_19]
MAAKDLAAFWPFVLRIGVSSVSDAIMTYIIAQKELDLVGAYTAYQSAIGIAIGFLYSSIFPLVTLMADAKGKEDDNESDAAKADARQKIQLIWRQGIIFTC